MTQIITFIGVGHLAEYMIQGLRCKGAEGSIFLVARSPVRAKALCASDARIQIADSAQAGVDAADIVVIATRPDDVEAALTPLKFRKDQVLISVAAGVDLDRLTTLCAPALAVRNLPLSCVSIQKSPTLMFPENPIAQTFLAQFGSVHVLTTEAQFPAATALTGALYAWMFALMDETHKWAKTAGLPTDMARDLVQDSFAGAAAMAQHQSNIGFDAIWETLATPGGISEQGHQVISDQGGFDAFSNALEAVRMRLDTPLDATSTGDDPKGVRS